MLIDSGFWCGSPHSASVAAAAKSLQSCLTLCDPTDGSPPGSSIHGIFQAGVLELGAIAFSSPQSKPHFIFSFKIFFLKQILTTFPTLVVIKYEKWILLQSWPTVGINCRTHINSTMVESSLQSQRGSDDLAKRWEPRGFSRVAAGISSYDGDLSELIFA